MAEVYFNSMDDRFKSPIGAVKNGTKVSLLIRVNFDLQYSELQYNKIDSFSIVSIPLNYIGNEGCDRVYKVEFSINDVGVFFYRFKLVDFDGRVFYLNRGYCQKGVLENHPAMMWQLTVYDHSLITPKEFWGKTMYQIFPDRFYKSQKAKKNVPTDRVIRSDWGGKPLYGENQNDKSTFIGDDYFGGDLKGIEEKLDYLKSLNISVIYLNPIFESHSNHRYNTANYFKIDPSLGDEEDFVSLCKAAHKRDMKVILDGVFSHVGSDSIYFNREGRYPNLGAYQSETSPYRSWFTFEDNPVGYKAWWGISSMPEICENDPSYTDFICGEKGVLAHWLKLGADGFRLDVADELPDEFLDNIRRRIKLENPKGLLIGEVWEDASTKHSHGGRRRYLLGRQLDGVMNYPFKNAILDFLTHKDALAFYESVSSIINNYPIETLNCCMNFISTHDTIRAINVLSESNVCAASRSVQAVSSLSDDEKNKGLELIKIAFSMLFTLNGIPSIYYGDEVGLSGWADPFNRLCFPWEEENESLLDFVKKLSQLRENEREIFAFGKFKFVFASNKIVCFKRFLNQRQITCLVNLSDNAVCVNGYNGKVILSSKEIRDGYLPTNAVMIGIE